MSNQTENSSIFKPTCRFRWNSNDPGRDEDQECARGIVAVPYTAPIYVRLEQLWISEKGEEDWRNRIIKKE
jgi:hypothetical protein